jgi:capsular polysaccharide transport system permease protein
MTGLYVSAIKTQGRVLGALMLRDMRTRFGRMFFGYIIMVLWPLGHLLSFLAVYAGARQIAPIGTNTSVFIATGILPYVLCLYPTRWIMSALVTNEPLLYFPIVKSLDVILARALLETITAFWVIAVFCFVLFLFDIDFYPLYPDEAFNAVLATIYLAFALGFVHAVLFKFVRAWGFVAVLSLIIMYLTSGTLLQSSNLPSDVQYYMSFNPLFHSVEWLRAAYYEGRTRRPIPDACPRRRRLA